MPRHTAVLLALAALSATAIVSLAQSATPAGQGTYQDTQNNTQNNSQMNGTPMQQQPAPIERGTPNNQQWNNQQQPNQQWNNQQPANQQQPNQQQPNQPANTYISDLHAGQSVAAAVGTASAQPAPGIFLRVGQNSSVQVVALGGEETELRVDRGIANIGIHQPVKNARILVDLPGGQTSLLKDGFYTFNADTKTIRVLKGEADAYPTNNADRRPIKVKENHAVIFDGREMKAFEFDPFEAQADLIPYGNGNSGPSPYGYYGSGPYGLAYGYPYWGYGYPYYFPFGFGWGWGWGWGGGWGGYYGGYYGGYRGGWGGGFHGGGGGGHGGGGGGGHR